MPPPPPVPLLAGFDLVNLCIPTILPFRAVGQDWFTFNNKKQKPQPPRYPLSTTKHRQRHTGEDEAQDARAKHKNHERHNKRWFMQTQKTKKKYIYIYVQNAPPGPCGRRRWS